MKVLVDRGLCRGYANCVIAEPRVFDLDDQGKVAVIGLPAELGEETRKAVQECPAHALIFED